MRIKREESDSLNFEESCELNGKGVIVLILKNHAN